MARDQSRAGDLTRAGDQSHAGRRSRAGDLIAGRMRAGDLARVGAAGLRSRPLRAVLAALGIAIGIAAMTAVVGISASSQAELQRTLDRLGTNLLTVGPGSKLFADEPAASRLGAAVGQPVWLGGEWFDVVGVLDPVPLAPELDSAALVGWDAAAAYLGFDGYPTTIYTRAEESSVEAVANVLANTANPESPSEVTVSRPSDALEAGRAADDAFTGLLLGLGAVALLVGGVGVANTMVISVLERRGEIGLRRSLGATQGQIRSQFLTESLLLCALGGLGGVLIGIGVTSVYATVQGWPSVVPAWASIGAVAATLLIGAVAGLYPAVRAARLSPTEALAAP